MSERKYFGTDGIRGRVGEFPVNAEFILKLGWAAGKVLGRNGGKVIIGKDTRISGYMFESVLEAGLASAGVDSYLLGPMPTPAIAYLTRTFRADAGIVISASHNPYYDNGIKFFSAAGTKLPDEIELEIESWLGKSLTTTSSEKLGKAYRVKDAAARYIEFCKSTIPSSIELSGLKVVLDCANGATYHIAPNVFEELGADVITIGGSPDGLNINRDCGATDVRALGTKVLEENADLGIAFDGDGDRVMMVDGQGRLVDGDQLLYIIARERHRRGSLQGGVVGTLMSNLGLEQGLSKLGISFVRSKVGDRYVIEKLLDNDWKLGGESSGHIICLDANSTGDGIVAALQVVATMMTDERSLAELAGEMVKCPQVLKNVPVAKGAKPLESESLQAAVTEVETALGDRGRVLLRASGTEPLIRVMVEGDTSAEIEGHASRLADVVSASAKAR